MDTILFQNILFGALSVFLVCVTLGFIVMMVFIILVLKSAKQFFDVIKKESEKISGDIESVRNKVKSSGAAVASFVVYALSFFKKNSKKSKER